MGQRMVSALSFRALLAVAAEMLSSPRPQHSRSSGAIPMRTSRNPASPVSIAILALAALLISPGVGRYQAQPQTRRQCIHLQRWRLAGRRRHSCKGSVAADSWLALSDISRRAQRWQYAASSRSCSSKPASEPRSIMRRRWPVAGSPGESESVDCPSTFFTYCAAAKRVGAGKRLKW